MTPLHAGGADIGAGDHRPAVGKVGPDAIVVERRFYALAHHQDLDAELHRLLPGALGQIGAVDALREAHVVFDHRGGAGLAPNGAPLDQYGAQTFRGGVHGRGQASRTSTVNRDVVLPQLGLGNKAEPVGNIPQSGAEEARSVGKFDDGQVDVLKVRQAQLAAVVLFGRELDPLKLDHTAFEKVANFPGAGVVAMPEESNDPHLGAAVLDLVSHTISPRPQSELVAFRRPTAARAPRRNRPVPGRTRSASLRSRSGRCRCSGRHA